MKALIQRVTRARVTVDGETIGRIERGYLVLLGVTHTDTDREAHYLAQRTVNLRVFPDAQGKMNLALSDVGGGVLVVSQFTLYADTRKGNRPSFIGAAAPEKATALYEAYVGALRDALGPSRVATGRFGAAMSVELVNDGPVTIEMRAESEGTGP
jgi:D-tyrosyl-tRNA(Tyr) deacylase